MRIITKMTTDRDRELSQTMTGLGVLTCFLAKKAETQGPVQITITIQKMINGIEGYTVNLDRMGAREERGLFKEHPVWQG